MENMKAHHVESQSASIRNEDSPVSARGEAKNSPVTAKHTDPRFADGERNIDTLASELAAQIFIG